MKVDLSEAEVVDILIAINYCINTIKLNTDRLVPIEQKLLGSYREEIERSIANL